MNTVWSPSSRRSVGIQSVFSRRCKQGSAPEVKVGRVSGYRVSPETRFQRVGVRVYTRHLLLIRSGVGWTGIGVSLVCHAIYIESFHVNLLPICFIHFLLDLIYFCEHDGVVVIFTSMIALWLFLRAWWLEYLWGCSFYARRTIQNC